MKSKSSKKLSRILSCIIALLGIVLCVGAKTVFSACEVGDDMVMSCHYAEQMVAALGVVIAICGIIGFVYDKAFAGLSIAVLLISILTVITPKIIIALCKMPDMHCNMMLRPYACVLGVLTAIVSVIGIVISGKRDHEKDI